MMSNPIDFLIALDDGHGMKTPGKRTPKLPDGTIIHENEFNRAVVKLMDADLKRIGFRTLLVAPNDDDPSLATRTNLANSKKADIYVSIHYDAFDGKFDGNDPSGHSLHIYPKSSKSRKLAECIHKYYIQGTVQNDRGIKESNFHVLRETKMPAVLSENGFMDNEKEAMLMLNKAFQEEVALEHVKGICDYFGVKYTTGATNVDRSDTAMTYYKRGSTGVGVRQLQTDLNALGYKMPIDGSFGPTTEVYVKQFQKDNNLAIDGSAGPKTLAKIAERIKSNQSKSKGLYKVQVGAFSEKDSAEQLREELERRGYKPIVKFE